MESAFGPLAHRRAAFIRSFQRLAELPQGALPDRQTLAELVYGWGNPAWSAKPDYLDGIMRAIDATTGPILECGNGLSTLVAGLWAKRRGFQVWSLENEPVWANVAERLVRHFQFDNVTVCLSPLRDYGDYVWYDPPSDRLPSDFGLVLCDGPAGDTPGGRYGLLPMMRPFLAHPCVVLLDDVAREGELHILDRWISETGATATLHGTDKPYAVVTMP
jgi:predicted O-methyltransferase YrrM